LKGLGKSVGLFSAFNQSNEVLKNLLKSLVQMLTETGYVNVDKNDFSSILSYEGESILGVGKAETEELAFEALAQALNNPLVSIANIDTAKGIIFQLFCKSEPKLSTYNGLIDHIREKITNKSVLIVSGVTLDPNLTSEIEILIVASGIASLSTKPNKIDVSTINEDDCSDDDLAFDELILNNGKEQSYTDIPAITRKLRANKLTGENNV
jgi:cell division protein FtsZ